MSTSPGRNNDDIHNVRLGHFLYKEEILGASEAPIRLIKRRLGIYRVDSNER